MPKVSFVIPVYNGWDMTHQLLGEILEKCKGVSEVLVVDNASEDPSVMKGLSFWKNTLKVLPIRVIPNKENFGFLKSANIGLRAATGDIVCLISNDVRIQSKYLLDTVAELLVEKPILS